MQNVVDEFTDQTSLAYYVPACPVGPTAVGVKCSSVAYLVA